MEKEARLGIANWVVLLEFVKGHAAEIGEFDDEDEINVAVTAVVAKIDQQLRS
jgi:hypothetical protein